MPNAYFLNGTQSPIILVLNNGVRSPLDPFNADQPTQNEATYYDIVQASQPGANKLGSANTLQVLNGGGSIEYTVSIAIDTNIIPLTNDLEFIVFADGVLGRQGITFDGINITGVDA